MEFTKILRFPFLMTSCINNQNNFDNSGIASIFGICIGPFSGQLPFQPLVSDYCLSLLSSLIFVSTRDSSLPLAGLVFAF